MKIAICIPAYGDVTAEFAYSLASMTAFSAPFRVDFNGAIVSPTLKIFMRSSSVLPQLRNMLVKDALEWDANFLLWLDTDQKFPEDALLRLLSLNLPVVGVNYPRRVAPHMPTATGLDETLIWTTEEAAKNDPVVQVKSLGFGCCLVDMSIFPRLHDHAVESGKPGMWPLFAVEMIADGTQIVGEDVYFFRQLEAAGIPVYLDHALSWAVGHVHQRVLTNSDAAPQPPLDVAAL